MWTLILSGSTSSQGYPELGRRGLAELAVLGFVTSVPGDASAAISVEKAAFMGCLLGLVVRFRNELIVDEIDFRF